MRIGGREALSSFRAATRNPEVPARDYVNKSPTCSLWTPHRVRGDTMRIGGGGGTLVIPRHDAESRNTRAWHNSGRTSRASLLHPLPPRSWTPHRMRVTRYVHSSLQREERIKKRRCCYRAISLGGWHRPRGLRNSLCSNSPRPSSSVDWPPPGPIKAGFAPPFPFAASLDPATSSYCAATRYLGVLANECLAFPFPGPRIECGVTHTLDLASGVG